MGCNCGGSRTGHALKARTLASRVASPGEKWRVLFPDGEHKDFDQEWMAHHAVSLLGGRIVHLTVGPGQNQA